MVIYHLLTHILCVSTNKYAGVAELADALDLGSNAIKYAGLMELADMQDLGSCVERRKGSSPLSCIFKGF